MKEPLTTSRMNCFLRCMRQHYLRYELGLQPMEKAEFLRFGSAWARAMEAKREGAPFIDALNAATAINANELDELQVATIAGLLAAYYDCVPPLAVKEMYAEVEFRLAIDGSRTFESAGKMDGLAQLVDGRIALLEDKTTSESIDSASEYWTYLQFNNQLFTYVEAARAHGWNVDTIIYGVTKKPAIKPCDVPVLDANGLKIVRDAAGQRVLKKDGSPRESGDKEKGYVVESAMETAEQYSKRLHADAKSRPEFYFAQREVTVLDRDIETFKCQRLQVGRMILDMRGDQKKLAMPEDAWPRTVGRATCQSCEFAPLCLQNIHIGLDAIPAGYRVEQNPELGGVK